MKPEENKRNELTMLVNKENQDVFLVVPNVVEGERYYIISACDFPQKYHIGDVYLSKEKWLKKLYREDIKRYKELIRKHHQYRKEVTNETNNNQLHWHRSLPQ